MEKKSKNIFIRVNDAELAAIKAKADAVNLSVSAYLRFVALNAVVEVKAE